MCDKQLQNKFEKQDSSETITISPTPINIDFIGPTVKLPAKLESKPTTKAFITQGVVLEALQPVCQSTATTLTFPASITIGKIKTGPYSDVGGQIDFRNLFYNFFDINYKANITYKFDPKLVCNESIPQTYNIDNKPFQAVVTSISFDRSKFFATNTDDDNNINKFQTDLLDLFQKSDVSGSLVEFHNAIVNGLLNQTGFGRKVEKELDRIYCANEPSSNSQVVNTYLLYEQKMKRLHQTGLYNLISKS